MCERLSRFAREPRPSLEESFRIGSEALFSSPAGMRTLYEGTDQVQGSLEDRAFFEST